jgi:predicted Zn-ribbon and HTH transcriptional regulator
MSLNGMILPFEIRKIIYEKFNDTNLRFTNDEIFELLKSNGLDSSLTIDDVEKYFNELRDGGLIRQIAQNFTTNYYKLFDLVEKIKCNSCNREIYLGKMEPRTCPECKAAI